MATNALRRIYLDRHRFFWSKRKNSRCSPETGEQRPIAAQLALATQTWPDYAILWRGQKGVTSGKREVALREGPDGRIESEQERGWGRLGQRMQVFASLLLTGAICPSSRLARRVCLRVLPPPPFPPTNAGAESRGASQSEEAALVIGRCDPVSSWHTPHTLHRIPVPCPLLQPHTMRVARSLMILLSLERAYHGSRIKPSASPRAARLCRSLS